MRPSDSKRAPAPSLPCRTPLPLASAAGERATVQYPGSPTLRCQLLLPLDLALVPRKLYPAGTDRCPTIKSDFEGELVRRDRGGAARGTALRHHLTKLLRCRCARLHQTLDNVRKQTV